MQSNVLFFGWNCAIPGREKISGEHFEEFVAYLGGLQKQGMIESFDTVFLDRHGGDLNGFFLIRGESAKLDQLASSDEWHTHQIRTMMHLSGVGAIRGVTGDAAMERMKVWRKYIPT